MTNQLMAQCSERRFHRRNRLRPQSFCKDFPCTEWLICLESSKASVLHLNDSFKYFWLSTLGHSVEAEHALQCFLYNIGIFVETGYKRREKQKEHPSRQHRIRCSDASEKVLYWAIKRGVEERSKPPGRLQMCRQTTICQKEKWLWPRVERQFDNGSRGEGRTIMGTAVAR